MSLFLDPNFVVFVAFVIFVGVLIYFKVPGMLGKALDARAEKIREELEEARRLREEAQTLLASYERKHREVEGQVEDIVAHARAEAEIASEQAKKDLEASIARRLRAAEDQIAAAETEAMREVRNRAVAVAIAAARDVIAKEMTPERRAALIDDSIRIVGEKLH